jgi:hypothetical protein
LFAGHAQAVDELPEFDAERLQHPPDLRPAAVNDDRIDADRLEQHDALRQSPRQFVDRPSRGRRTSPAKVRPAYALQEGQRLG